MQFVMLTDPHFVAPGRRLYGIDPAERLALAVETIKRDHKDLAFLVITGDLAHWGDAAAYLSLSSVLAGIEVPVILLVGNHDRRTAYRSVFVGADQDPSGFVQAVRRYDQATIVTLDTLDETAKDGSGKLCERRLAFLEDALACSPPDKPLLLFQHHPPFETGLKHMDNILLRNHADQWDVIERTRKPDYLFAGHLHRPVSGVWRGVPFHIQRGLGHQVAFDLEATHDAPGSLEAPDYALVTVRDGDVVIHQCSFLDGSPRFLLGDAAARDAETVEDLLR